MDFKKTDISGNAVAVPEKRNLSNKIEDATLSAPLRLLKQNRYDADIAGRSFPA